MVGLHNNNNVQLKVALQVMFKQGFNRSWVPGKIMLEEPCCYGT